MTTPPVRRIPFSPDLGEPTDTRLNVVLEVLAGADAGEVARHHCVEPMLVRRWVQLFIEAGISRLANAPEPSLARQRDRFLAAFAHELRTPLAIAKGWASLLADGDLPPEMAVTTAAKLTTALDAVAERICEVEFLSATALGRLSVARCPVTAETLISPDLGARAVGDLETVVHTDPQLAARIVHDLWTATLLEPAPVERHIELHVVRPWVELRIVREGKPIEPRVLQALFDPFDDNDDDTGVTLGLYLARALSVALGGAIGLEQDPHRTIFWLRIPLALPKENAMTFKLACGDVMPGCTATFEHVDKNVLISQVAAHAAADHGITDITPEMFAAVDSRIFQTA